MSGKLVKALYPVVIVALLLSACVVSPPQVVVPTQVNKETPAQVVVPEKVVTATAPAPIAAPTQAPAEAAAQPAGTLVLAALEEPDTLNPLISTMLSANIILSTVNLGCFDEDEKGNFIPLGCESVPTLDNGGARMVGEGQDQHLEVTYKIRQGWRWTDGEPVTARDAVYIWQLRMNPDTQVLDRSTDMKLYDVVAVDDHTIRYVWMSENQARQAAAGTLQGNVSFASFRADFAAAHYDEQQGPVVDPVYWTFVGWAPEHAWSKIPIKELPSSEATSRKVMGDGPYYIKEWKPGQEIVLERSDQPFPLGEPRLKTIIYRFFSNTEGVIEALRRGEIDAVTGLGGLNPAYAPDLAQIEAAGQYKVMWVPSYRFEHIDFNLAKFPFDDVRVRQALAYATNKQDISDKFFFGKQISTDLPVPTVSWSYTDQYTKYPYDIAKAQQLLHDAGWDCSALPCTKQVTENGREVTRQLEFTLMSTDRSDIQAIAQIIQAQWKKVNVGVNLQFLNAGSLFASCAEGGPLLCRTFDAVMFSMSYTDDTGSLNTYGCRGIPTKENGYAGFNVPGFCNTEADQALYKSEIDPSIALSRARRKPYLEQFYQIWTANVPVIPLFILTTPYVYRAGFTNWRPGPGAGATGGRTAWQWELTK